MPKELFINKRFNDSSTRIIIKANEIIQEYSHLGFTLTLRQLYYQFVARGLIPNDQKEYKRLGSIVNDARLAGLIDWNMIEDRTRYLRDLPNWENPEALIDACASQYRSDIWAKQPIRPEIWIEKDALIGVIEPVCNVFRIPYFACRGYSSQSEQWRAGHRFRRHIRNDQRIMILHFGDHDPSGVDMTRDNEERLRLFAHAYGGIFQTPTNNFELRRIALNMNQVKQYNPPPNPAKLTDSRAINYIEQYGNDSWELDALDPTVIDSLIREQINDLIDRAAWDAVLTEEENDRTILTNISRNWDDVKEQFGM